MRKFFDLQVLSLLLACAVTTSASVSAAEEEALESQEPPLALSWVVEEATSRNPDIRASLSRWEASQEAIDGAKSLDDPRLGFQLRNAKSPVQVEDGWQRYRRMGSVSQKIPFPGKLRLRGEIASDISEMSKKDWEETIRIITALAKTAYYDLHYINKAIDINEGNRELLENFAKTAETRYRVGEAPQRDILAAQVELAKIINDLQVLGEEKRTAETRINTLLNRDPEAPLGRPEDYTPHKLTVNLEDVEEMAVKSRPGLKKFDLSDFREYPKSLAGKDFKREIAVAGLLGAVIEAALFIFCDCFGNHHSSTKCKRSKN